MTLAALRHSEETDQGPVGPINQQRALILEKARAAIAPNLNTDMRRDPRDAVRRSRRACASGSRASSTS